MRASLDTRLVTVNSALSAPPWLVTISYPTRAHGIIVNHFTTVCKYLLRVFAAVIFSCVSFDIFDNLYPLACFQFWNPYFVHLAYCSRYRLLLRFHFVKWGLRYLSSHYIFGSLRRFCFRDLHESLSVVGTACFHATRFTPRYMFLSALRTISLGYFGST